MKYLTATRGLLALLLGMVAVCSPATGEADISPRHWEPARFEVSLSAQVLIAEVDVMLRVLPRTFLGVGSGYGIVPYKLVTSRESHLTGGSIIDLQLNNRPRFFITHVWKNLFFTLGGTRHYFFHFDDSDDDPGAGIGYSLYGMLELTTNNRYGKYFRFGLRAGYGSLDEGRHDKRNGVLVSPIPITVRLAIPF